jgi:hypothetical protein
MLAGYCAILTQVPIGTDAVALWQVDDLERYVDRRALLAGDDPEEPPYWAHLWSGARIDTREFYPELAALGLEVETTSRRVEADGVTEVIALSAIRWPGSAPRPAPGHSPYFSILR